MRLASIGAIVAIAFLAGCGARWSDAGSTIMVDKAKMAQVEQSALRHGIEVIWVNPPTTVDPFR
jgi:hypothetical protein